MKYRYFKIIGQNPKDITQIDNILNSKDFYPDFYSTPQLPVNVISDVNFDYRLFFILISVKLDEHPIVYTREPLTLAEFKSNIISDNDWTNRYYVDVVPTTQPINVDLLAKYDPNYHAIFPFFSYPQKRNI
jgi:hypothetical protein